MWECPGCGNVNAGKDEVCSSCGEFKIFLVRRWDPKSDAEGEVVSKNFYKRMKREWKIITCLAFVLGMVVVIAIWGFSTF